QNKCERSIRIHCNDHRNNGVTQLLGFTVKLFTEFHNVHTLLSERRSNGRCWICLPCRNLKLNSSSYLFCHIPAPYLGCYYLVFSTWPKSNSTGVGRPNIETKTFNLP